MHWLAEGDPVKLKAVSEMAGIEFFMLLDKRIAEMKREAARVRSAANKKQH